MNPKHEVPTDTQLWFLDYKNDDTFFVVSKSHGKVLDCGDSQEGTKLVLKGSSGLDSQRWKMDGNYLMPATSELVVAVEGNSTSAGAHLILSTRSDPASKNQQFEFEELVSNATIATVKSEGFYTSGMYMENALHVKLFHFMLKKIETGAKITACIQVFGVIIFMRQLYICVAGCAVIICMRALMHARRDSTV